MVTRYTLTGHTMQTLEDFEPVCVILGVVEVKEAYHCAKALYVERVYHIE